MAFLDILRGRKREEQKPERLPKGAFSPKANRPLAEKRPSFAKTSAFVKTSADKPAGRFEKPAKKQPAKMAQSALAAEFLLHPHITEKSTALANRGIYTFKVASPANKIIVGKAFYEMYGFKPMQVRIVNALPKKRKVRGKIGVKPGFKKALIYLKEGDKIEFI